MEGTLTRNWMPSWSASNGGNGFNGHLRGKYTDRHLMKFYLIAWMRAVSTKGNNLPDGAAPGGFQASIRQMLPTS